MALINEEESEGAALVREFHEAIAKRLRGAKSMKKYITVEQWWDGHMTIERGPVTVPLSEARAAELVERGFIKEATGVPVPEEDAPIGPPGSAPKPTSEEDDPIGPPEVAPEPQNRRVTTAGTAGPKRK